MDGPLLGLLVGILQGILEWLPVSSEGGVTLALSALGVAAEEATAFALVLHGGTAVAATVYYRATLADLLARVPDWRPGSAFQAGTADLSFYVLATLASGVTGVSGFLLLEELASVLAGGAFLALIGVLLLVTGALLWIGEREEARQERSKVAAGAGQDGDAGAGQDGDAVAGQDGAVQRDDAQRDDAHGDDPTGGSGGFLAARSRPTAVDAVLVGLLQGLAVLPGISRSGTTVSALLLRGHDGPAAIQLSFVLSIPAALGAGTIAYLETGLPGISPTAAGVALVASAVVGYATVDGLTRLARRLAFSRICVGFGTLAIVGGVLVVV